MAQFKDSEGREWSVKVVVDLVEKVREIGVDLVDVTGQAMKRLANDDVLLVRVMWLICEQQADDQHVTPAQFGAAMFGDALDSAYEALRGALDDFFPRRKRDFWRKMMATDAAQQAAAMEIGLEALNDPATMEKITDAMRVRVKEEVKNALTQLQSVIASPES
jgi:hypothetical protein